MTANLLFREQQRFRQWWLWTILTGINLFTAILLLTQCDSNTPYYIPLLVSLPSVLLLLLFGCIRLDTEIREDGIYVRFFPFRISFRHYPWEQIDRLCIRQYEPVKEYGGWGVRGTSSNRALNIAGNQGLQLLLNDRSKLLIGTQQPNNVAAAIALLPQEIIHRS